MEPTALMHGQLGIGADLAIVFVNENDVFFHLKAMPAKVDTMMGKEAALDKRGRDPHPCALPRPLPSSTP